MWRKLHNLWRRTQQSSQDHPEEVSWIPSWEANAWWTATPYCHNSDWELGCVHYYLLVMLWAAEQCLAGTVKVQQQQQHLIQGRHWGHTDLTLQRCEQRWLVAINVLEKGQTRWRAWQRVVSILRPDKLHTPFVGGQGGRADWPPALDWDALFDCCFVVEVAGGEARVRVEVRGTTTGPIRQRSCTSYWKPS